VYELQALATLTYLVVAVFMADKAKSAMAPNIPFDPEKTEAL